MTCRAAFRGAEAESMFCTEALKLGYIVSFPARGLQPEYDLIIDVGDRRLRTVQVKRTYTRQRGNYHQVRVSITDTSNKRYTNVDLLAIVQVEGERVWLIPHHCVRGRKSLTMNNPVWRPYRIR